MVGYRRPALLAAAVLAAIVAAWMTTCDLSERPPRQAPPGPPSYDSTSSQIGARIILPMTALESELENYVPRSLHGSGSGRRLCTNIGPIGRRCAPVRYDYEIQRRGRVTPQHVDDDTLLFSSSFEIRGTGGLEGEIARLLGVNSRPFEAAVRLDTHVDVAIDDTWCPQTDVSLSFEWASEPRVEIVDGVWVDISANVTTALEERLSELEDLVAGVLDCSLRESVARIYKVWSFPLDLPGTSLHLNVSPQDLSLTRLGIEESRLSLGGSLDAELEISSRAVSARPLPLPSPGRLEYEPTLNLELPVIADYESVQKALGEAIVGREFRIASPTGPAALRVEKLEVYPSGRKLALELHVTIDLPDNWLDTRGTVYVTGSPRIRRNHLLIENLAFTPELDNAFWAGGTRLLRKQILDRLEQLARVNLRPHLRQVERALAEAPGTKQPGVHFEVSNIEARVRRLELRAVGLVAHTRVTAHAEITVQSLPTRARQKLRRPQTPSSLEDTSSE